MPTIIIGIENAMNSGGVIITAPCKYTESILSKKDCATIIPTKSITPPANIINPIGFEPYLFDIKKVVPVSTTAGATPMEINWNIFGAGSNSIIGSIMKL